MLMQRSRALHNIAMSLRTVVGTVLVFVVASAAAHWGSVSESDENLRQTSDGTAVARGPYNRTLEIGNCTNPYRRLAFHDVVSRCAVYNNRVSTRMTYSTSSMYTYSYCCGPSPQEYRRECLISCVQAVDRLANGYSGSCSVRDGGPSYNSVELLFEAPVRQGFYFEVWIYTDC